MPAAGPGKLRAQTDPGCRARSLSAHRATAPRLRSESSCGFRSCWTRFRSARASSRRGKINDLKKTKAPALGTVRAAARRERLTQSPEGQPVPLAQHQVEPGVVPPQPLPVAGGQQQPGDLGVDAAILVAHHEGVHGEGQRAPRPPHESRTRRSPHRGRCPSPSPAVRLAPRPRLRIPSASAPGARATARVASATRTPRPPPAPRPRP